MCSVHVYVEKQWGYNALIEHHAFRVMQNSLAVKSVWPQEAGGNKEIAVMAGS